MARRIVDNWQSFADIALAFMATLLLVLVVVWQKQATVARQSKAEAQQLTEFTGNLLEALQDASSTIRAQDDVERWISHVFTRTDCFLDFNSETKRLEPRAQSDQATTQLYPSGEVRLSSDAIDKLQTCKEAFRILAGCMSDDPRVRGERCPDDASKEWRDSVGKLREDVEALVLQGNTDRVHYGDASRVHGLRSSSKRLSHSFVANAQLGSERARQALGHLVALVQTDDELEDQNTSSALHIFLSRARIESPSFGRYQAGPQSHRETAECKSSLDCPDARNLSMRLQWRTEKLRTPFKDVLNEFCGAWKNPDHQVHKSLKAANRKQQADTLCGTMQLGSGTE